MKYETYYHGYPTSWKGWLSCYQWEVFPLNYISTFISWFYHNLMAFFNIRIALKADKIIFVSYSAMKDFFEKFPNYIKRNNPKLWNEWKQEEDSVNKMINRFHKE